MKNASKKKRREIKPVRVHVTFSMWKDVQSYVATYGIFLTFLNDAWIRRSPLYAYDICKEIWKVKTLPASQPNKKKVDFDHSQT